MAGTDAANGGELVEPESKDPSQVCFPLRSAQCKHFNRFVSDKISLMWFVYILLCEDGSLYTGYSNNIEQRFQDHKNGKGGHYTRSHKPLRLIYQKIFNTQSEALKKEKQIKGWTREKKIRILKLVF